MLSVTSSLRIFKDKNLHGSMIEMAYGAPLETDPRASLRARADETDKQRAVSRCALVLVSKSPTLSPSSSLWKWWSREVWFCAPPSPHIPN